MLTQRKREREMVETRRDAGESNGLVGQIDFKEREIGGKKGWEEGEH